MKIGDSRERTAFLLDTSAVVALTDAVAGADRVERILRSEPVLLPFVVSLEVYYVSLQERGVKAANIRYAMLKALDATQLNEVSESVLLTAGR